MDAVLRRHRQMLAQRSQGGTIAREVPIPLPTKGILSEARSGAVSGSFASVLSNLKSNGVYLEFAKSPTYGPPDEIAQRRIPFEFGSYQQYIDITETRLNSGNSTLERVTDRNASVAYISSQAVIADGLGAPVTFDGVDFTERYWTTDVGGVEVGLFDGVVAHHDRLFFWREEGDLEFYYADDVGAVQGGLTRFPLGRLGNITGQIKAIFSLTMDAGENTNDSLCIITTTGHVAVYEGLDPSDSENWRSTTRVKVSPPISRHGFSRVGGDVWMMTATGVVSILDSLRQGALALVSTVSRAITKEIQSLVEQGGGEWQLHTSASGDLIIINRYDSGAGTAYQFNYSTENPAWYTSEFPSVMFHTLELRTEFTAHNGRLGTLSRAEANDAETTATWETGWFNIKKGTELCWVQPSIIATGPLSVTITVLADHDATQADIAEAEQTVTIEPDDTADPGGEVALNELFAVDAVGEFFKLRMSLTASWARIVSVKAGVK